MSVFLPLDLCTQQGSFGDSDRDASLYDSIDLFFFNWLVEQDRGVVATPSDSLLKWHRYRVQVNVDVINILFLDFIRLRYLDRSFDLGNATVNRRLVLLRLKPYKLVDCRVVWLLWALIARFHVFGLGLGRLHFYRVRWGTHGVGNRWRIFSLLGPFFHLSQYLLFRPVALGSDLL